MTDVEILRLARVQEALMAQALPGIIRIDNLPFHRLSDDLPRYHNNELSKRLTHPLDNLILFLSLKHLAHLHKRTYLVPGHVLEENVVFERYHDTAFGLFGFGDEVVGAFGLLLVEEDGSATFGFRGGFADGLVAQSHGLFLGAVHGELVVEDDFLFDLILVFWLLFFVFLMFVNLLEFSLGPQFYELELCMITQVHTGLWGFECSSYMLS